LATSRHLLSLSQATKRPDSGSASATANDEYPYREDEKTAQITLKGLFGWPTSGWQVAHISL